MIKPPSPKPLYPMYPEGHKAPKPKIKKDRVCLCFPKWKKHKNAIDIVKQKVEGRALEFWSVFGVPYILVTQGVISSTLCPVIGLVYRNDCPALPILIPVLIARAPLAFADALSLFLMSAEAFDWGKSNNWVSKVMETVNWRIVAGVLLAFYAVWGTALFNSTHSRYTDGKPVSYDAESPQYCHPALYKFTKMNQVLILIYLGGPVFLFILGGTILLSLLCLISRMGS